MLKKTRTPGIWKFKYLLLAPVVTLMLSYSACKDEYTELEDATMQVADVEQLTADEERQLYSKLISVSGQQGTWNFTVTDGNSTIHFTDGEGDAYISGPNGEEIPARMVIEGKITADFGGSLFGAITPVPFGTVEQVPLFPGCEDASDPRECFNRQLMEHVRKNFNYPKEAIDQGISGRVDLLFTIDENGKAGDIRTRGPHEILESEAERIILRLPDMQPGKQQDKAVKVYYSIPITFQLD
jgi:TonB family protein